MPLSSSKRALLADLVARLPEEVIWCVFGSTNAALRGADEDPGDVDVLTTHRGGRTIRETLSESFVGTGEVGVSQVDEYRLHGERLEVVYSDPTKDHQEPLVDLENADPKVTSEGVPLLGLPELVAAYRAMGETETAAKLESTFSEQLD